LSLLRAVKNGNKSTEITICLWLSQSILHDNDDSSIPAADWNIRGIHYWLMKMGPIFSPETSVRNYH